MIEQYLRSEIFSYLLEQEIRLIAPWTVPTAILCLIAAINGYSFSDDMINDLPQFIPTEEEINKYK